MVISAVNEREHQRQQSFTPKSKDVKKFNLFGRKLYSTAGLQLKIAKQVAGSYDFNLWDNVLQCIDKLPEEARLELHPTVHEGKLVPQKRNNCDPAATSGCFIYALSPGPGSKEE